MRRAVGLGLGVGALLALSHLLVEALHLRFAQAAADESIRGLEVFRAHRARAEVALLGSSQMRRAVIAPQLSRELAVARGRPVEVFNLGLQAGTLPAYTVVARDLLGGTQTPRVIVLGLGARCANSNSPRHARVIRHLLAPGDWLGPMGARLSKPAELGAVPVAAFRAPATLLTLWRHEDPDFAAGVLASGGSIHAPQDAAPPEPREAIAALSARTIERARENRDELLVDFDPWGRAAASLAALADLAHERDIALFVVNLPVSAQFAHLAYTRGEYAAYLDMVRSVCERTHTRFVDMNEPAMPVQFFDDGDHLNAPGAARVTELLAQTLAPILERRTD